MLPAYLTLQEQYRDINDRVDDSNSSFIENDYNDSTNHTTNHCQNVLSIPQLVQLGIVFVYHDRKKSRSIINDKDCENNIHNSISRANRYEIA